MKLWSVDHLADYLGVPRTWIYDRTREDGPERIPHVKLGKYVRFNPDSVEFQRWLSDHVVGSDTQRGLQASETKRLE